VHADTIPNVKQMDKIQLLPSGAVFDCRTTAAMGEAYDKACQSMQDWGQPEIIKETIAKRIIEVAQRGESDPDKICELALKSLGFSEPGSGDSSGDPRD
jgi:hypothetical protein